MTREEANSCIGTIEMLQRLAYNIHGVMDVIDADNCKKIIKALEQEPFINKPCISKGACQHHTEDVLDKIRAEIERQEKWLLQAGCNTYNVDIALDAIKSVVAESEGNGSV